MKTIYMETLNHDFASVNVTILAKLAAAKKLSSF